MMIERQQGDYVHRYDPVLVARAIEIRRREAGSFREMPRKRKVSR